MAAGEGIKVRVVLFENADGWVAQCLEHDIAAFAPTLAGVTRKFERTIAANVLINAELGRAGLEGIPPAPARFTALYEESGLDLSARATAATAVQADLRIAEAA